MLTLFVFEHDVRADIVGKLARIVLFKHIENYLGRHLRNNLGVVLKIVLRLTNQSGCIVLVVGFNADFTADFNVRNQIRLALKHINHSCPCDTVNRNTNRVTVRQAQDMTDFCNRAYFIKFVNIRLIVSDVLLGDEKNLLIVRHGGFDSL